MANVRIRRDTDQLLKLVKDLESDGRQAMEFLLFNDHSTSDTDPYGFLYKLTREYPSFPCPIESDFILIDLLKLIDKEHLVQRYILTHRSISDVSLSSRSISCSPFLCSLLSLLSTSHSQASSSRPMTCSQNKALTKLYIKIEMYAISRVMTDEELTSAKLLLNSSSSSPRSTDQTDEITSGLQMMEFLLRLLSSSLNDNSARAREALRAKMIDLDLSKAYGRAHSYILTTFSDQSYIGLLQKLIAPSSLRHRQRLPNPSIFDVWTTDGAAVIPSRKIYGSDFFGPITKEFHGRTRTELAVTTYSNNVATAVIVEDCKKLMNVKHPCLMPIVEIHALERRLMYSFFPIDPLSTRHEKLQSWHGRARILYQIGNALAYLHSYRNQFSSYENSKMPMVHGNVHPDCIFMDANNNAILMDLVTSRILTKMNKIRRSRRRDVFKEASLDGAHRPNNPCDDVYNLGILTLHLLKWPNGLYHEDLLNNFHTAIETGVIDDIVDKIFWGPIAGGERAATVVVSVASRCLTGSISSADYTSELKTLLYQTDTRYQEFAVLPTKCTFCRVDDADDVLKTTSSTCKSDCLYKRFCRKCIRNAYRNPLWCLADGPISTIFNGENTLAILMRGMHVLSHEVEAFQKDINHVVETFTDPHIIGIRRENIIELPLGNDTDQLKMITDRVKGRKLDFLLVYYTGHTPIDGKIQFKIENDAIDSCNYSSSEISFEKSESEDDPPNQVNPNVDIKEFQQWLSQFNIDHCLTIVDCCDAANVEILPRRCRNSAPKWHVNLSACGGDGDQTGSPMGDKASRFTRHLLTGLAGADHCPCSDDDRKRCRAFDRVREEAKDCGYVSLDSLFKYLRDPGHCPKCRYDLINSSVSGSEIPLAFFNKK